MARHGTAVCHSVDSHGTILQGKVCWEVKCNCRTRVLCF